jgi:hypothetical protein
MANRRHRDWALPNPIVAKGAIAFETDTGRFKIGDGKRNWSELPYVKKPVDAGDLVKRAALRTLAIFWGELPNKAHAVDDIEEVRDGTMTTIYTTRCGKIVPVWSEKAIYRDLTPVLRSFNGCRLCRRIIEKETDGTHR